MPAINSSGVEIDYEILNPDGFQTPIFFISGLNGIRGAWSLQAEHFSKQRPVVLHDHRGTGLSAKPSGVYSIEKMAGDVISIMNNAGIDTAHMVGSSTGGAIIQVLAIDNPDRVRSASICSSWPKSDHFFRRQFSMRKKVLLEMGWEDYMKISALALNSPEYFNEHFEEIEKKEKFTVQNAPPAIVMAERIDCIMEHDQMERLNKITAPTLIAVARDDTCTPSYYSDQLVEKIPNAKLKVFDSGGHFVYMAYPDEFNTVIREFVEENDF